MRQFFRHALLHALCFAPRQRACGSLIAVSSLSGKRGIPSYALYGASKSAVFRDCMKACAWKMAPAGVHVARLRRLMSIRRCVPTSWDPTAIPGRTNRCLPFRIWPVDLVLIVW